jgi:hypothetical protein
MGVEAAEALDPSRGMSVGRSPSIWRGNRISTMFKGRSPRIMKLGEVWWGERISSRGCCDSCMMGRKDFLAWQKNCFAFLTQSQDERIRRDDQYSIGQPVLFMLRAGILEPAKIKEVCAINKMYTIEILRKEAFEDTPFDYKRWSRQWHGTAEERGIWKVGLNDLRVFPVSAGFADFLQAYNVGWEIS